MQQPRAEIEAEADRLIAGHLTPKLGMREHVVASCLYYAGHDVDVVCPKCNGALTVIEFPAKNGCNIECPCGTCSGAMRGL